MALSNAFILTLIVLLPLIPAYVLYRFVGHLAEQPGASAEGLLSGVKFKLAGPFAAYFVLFTALSAIAMTLPAHDVWTVRGQIAYADGRQTFDESVVRFVVKPPGLDLNPDGSFRLTLFRMTDPSGEAALPTVFIDSDGYQPIRLDLDSGSRRLLKRQLVLPDPLTLQPRPALAAHEEH